MSDTPPFDDCLPELIARARRGDEAASAEIYHHYVRPLYRLAYGVLLDVQDAEEVVQDAFVYAFRNLERFDPSRAAFRTWLYTIAMSRCRNKRRRRWIPTISWADVVESLPAAGPQPERMVEEIGIRDTVLGALRQLSPKLREAVVLRYFDGLTYREMAEVLSCPQKTAESRVRLAHTALSRILDEQRDDLTERVFT